MLKNLSIYLHIPFCKKKCAYCNFYRVIWSEAKEKEFLVSLAKEISYYQHVFPDYQIKTLFIGGGTPSCLSLSGLEELLNICAYYFNLKNIKEKTIELNPESVTYEKLKLMHDFSVNRLSMGIQSMNDTELTILGRIHTSAEAELALRLFKDLGFLNFNLDYMFGLPGATTESTRASIVKLLAYEPTHLSTYALSIEEQTRFKKKKQPIVTELESLKIFRFLRNFLKRNGFNHYEVSNFAKNNLNCQHNLNYWQGGAYLGFGPGAHSYFENKRFANQANLESYLQDPLPVIAKYVVEKLDKDDKIIDFLLCQLRLINGFKLSLYQKLFNQSFLRDFAVPIRKLTDAKLLKITNAKVKVTAKGLYLLDTVLEELVLGLTQQSKK